MPLESLAGGWKRGAYGGGGAFFLEGGYNMTRFGRLQIESEMSVNLFLETSSSSNVDVCSCN